MQRVGSARRRENGKDGRDGMCSNTQCCKMKRLQLGTGGKQWQVEVAEEVGSWCWEAKECSLATQD